MIELAHKFPGGYIRLPHRSYDVADISLSIQTGPLHTPTVFSPFLNGKITAGGTFIEGCPQNDAKLRKGMHGLIRIPTSDLAFSVLILDLQTIECPRSRWRHYVWEYGVTGVACDKTRIFPIGEDREYLSTDDLVSLLGGSRSDIGSGAFFNSEGGFTLDESLGRFSK